MDNATYRIVRHRIGHEGTREGYHIYVLTEQNVFYNFYTPKGLPEREGALRLVLDVGKCDPEHFYDLEYKRGELLEQGDANIEFDEKSINLFLSDREYRLIPRQQNQYLCLLKGFGYNPKIPSNKELILT